MSRTDKDKPLHARAVWWEPMHWGCRYHVPRHAFARLRRECDLPAEPDPSSYDRTERFGRSSGWTCIWLPVWDRNRCRPAPPQWFVRHVWTGRERVAVRDLGRRAAAEYRASGDVEVELPAGQHRHCAYWLWW